MKFRTNVHVDRGAVDYLHERGENCSEIANMAFLARATELGYADLKGDIKKLESKLGRLRIHLKKKSETDTLEEQFNLQFLGYLSTRSIESHTTTHIKAWLLGPGNREFSHIIGHPGDLTDEKVAGLIARAHTHKDGKSKEE